MAMDIQGVAPLFQVFDILASIRFYHDFLGFELVQTSKPLSEKPDDVNWAMLRPNGVTLMLNTAYEPEFRPQAPDPARFAAHADASLHFGCPDVDQACRQLRSLGIHLKEPVIAPTA